MSPREGTDGTGPAPLLIPADVFAGMIAHCQREVPVEACGILGGSGSRVSSLHVLQNEEVSQKSYKGNGREVIEAFRTLRERGQKFLAIYHSHPRWRAIPSRSDLERNYYEDLPRIIVSLLTDPPEVRAWQFGTDSYRELPYEVVSG